MIEIRIVFTWVGGRRLGMGKEQEVLSWDAGKGLNLLGGYIGTNSSRYTLRLGDFMYLMYL